MDERRNSRSGLREVQRRWLADGAGGRKGATGVAGESGRCAVRGQVQPTGRMPLGWYTPKLTGYQLGPDWATGSRRGQSFSSRPSSRDVIILSTGRQRVVAIYVGHPRPVLFFFFQNRLKVLPTFSPRIPLNDGVQRGILGNRGETALHLTPLADYGFASFSRSFFSISACTRATSHM